MIQGFYEGWLELGQQMIDGAVEGTQQVLGLWWPASRSDPGERGERRVSAPGAITLSTRQRRLLEHIVRCPTAAQQVVKRSRIILALAAGESARRIARTLETTRATVYKWRARWFAHAPAIAQAELQERRDQRLQAFLTRCLRDAYRRGSPATFRPEQLVKIIALACEHPLASGRPITQWSSRELAAELVKRGIVTSISRATVSRLLAEAKIKPHRCRYWLNAQPDDEAQFHEQVRVVCALYRQAADWHAQGIHLVCTDEKTGIQALERDAPTKGVKPGWIMRMEANYTRHGTRCLIANLVVATGQIISPSIGPTRTEADFLTHIQRTVTTDPAGQWIFVLDNLNTHQSASLVQWVAQQCQLTNDLGVKGRRGILRSMASRAAFLAEPAHRIRFVYVPKHTSWLNQIEIWFSILAGRLLKRIQVRSTDELQQQMLDFIDYFNATLAKPFKWTYAGKPLAV
jgi:transposase